MQLPCSDPGAMFRTEDMTRLLCLCGYDKQELARASNYDYFCMICHSLPLCEGHPLAAIFRAFFCMHYGIREDAFSDPRTLWRQLVEELMRSPILHRPIPAESPTPRPSIPLELPSVGTVRFLTEELLASATRTPYETERIWRACAARETLIALRVPSDGFSSPNPYGVGQALKQPTSPAAQAVLTAQAVRCMTTLALETNRELLLVGGTSYLLSLLAYLERSVGLPTLLIDLDDPIPLLPFLEQHGARARLAISKDHASEERLTELSRIYPLGRLYLYEEK